MKKSKKIVLLCIAIIAVILACIGEHAYAKYMSRVSGKGTAEIANWSFKVNENDEKMQTISLKSTINNETLVNNKIAPGTEGNFQIKLDATNSDVGINYNIKFANETQKPTNLKFVYDGITYNSITELGNALNGTINANEDNKIKTLSINWNWKYETGNTVEEINANDIIDTQEAKKIDDYNFDVIISGIQVIPQN